MDGGGGGAAGEALELDCAAGIEDQEWSGGHGYV
jgi:hypothetical protein